MFSSVGNDSRTPVRGVQDFTTAEYIEEDDMLSDETENDVVLSAPSMPTSRARLSSSMRAKKAPGACIDNLAIPSKGSGMLLKENIALGSPISNLITAVDPAGLASRCLSKPFDLASENSHAPLAEREIVANYGSLPNPQFVSSPTIMPTLFTPAKESNAQMGSIFDDRINVSGDNRGFSREQSTFSFLTAQEPPAPQTPGAENFALHPATTPSSGKKWRDDGTLRLKKNLRVWFLSSDYNWIAGTVITIEDTEAVVRTPDQLMIKVNASSLQPANPEILEGVFDLIKLSYLNEPSVLHNLAFRYAKDKIYTRAGPVLIAVNPFKKVPIYGPDSVQAYQKRTPESSHPHVYMTADTAFNAMMRGTQSRYLFSGGRLGLFSVM